MSNLYNRLSEVNQGIRPSQMSAEMIKILDNMKKMQSSPSQEHFESQHSVGSPTYWGDYLQGVSDSAPADYSEYYPKERFNIAKALELANQVSPGSEEIVLNALTPRMAEVPQGIFGLAKQFGGALQGGAKVAESGKKARAQQALKDWEEQQRQQREAEKFEFNQRMEMLKLQEKWKLEEMKQKAADARQARSEAASMQRAKLAQSHRRGAIGNIFEKQMANDLAKKAFGQKFEWSNPTTWFDGGDAKLKDLMRSNPQLLPSDIERLHNESNQQKSIEDQYARDRARLNILSDDGDDIKKKEDGIFKRFNEWFYKSRVGDDKEIHTARPDEEKSAIFDYISPKVTGAAKKGWNSTLGMAAMPAELLGADSAADFIRKGKTQLYSDELPESALGRSIQNIGSSLVNPLTIVAPGTALAGSIGAEIAGKGLDSFSPDKFKQSDYYLPASIATGIVGGGAGIKAPKAAKNAYVHSHGFKKDLLPLYEEIGIKPTISNMTTSPTRMQADIRLKDKVLASKIIKNAMNKESHAVSKALGSVADESFDPNRIMAGDDLYKKIKDMSKLKREKASQLYDKMEDTVYGKLGGDYPILFTPESAAPKGLKPIDILRTEKGISEFNALAEKDTLRLADAKRAKLKFAEKADFGAIDPSDLSRDYRNLYKYVKTSIEESLPADVVSQQKKADNFYKTFKENEFELEKQIGSKKGTELQRNYKIWSDLVSDTKESGELINLVNKHPEGASSINKSLLWSLGKGDGNEFNFTRLKSAYKNLSNKRTKETILKHLSPAEKDQFLSSLEVIQRWTETGKEGNFSGTGKYILGGEDSKAIKDASLGLMLGDKRALGKIRDIVKFAGGNVAEAAAVNSPSVYKMLTAPGLSKKRKGAMTAKRISDAMQRKEQDEYLKKVLNR